MAWILPDRAVIRERTPGERLAYVQGFKAAAGMAVKYESDGKPMSDLQQLADLMPLPDEADDGQKR